MTREIDAIINVIARRDPANPGKIVFHPESDWANGDELTFKSPKKGDKFRMLFKLDDGTLGLKFMTAKKEAFWVVKGGPCPKAPAYDKEFEAKRVWENRKTLEVVNTNGNIAEYHYVLRFEDENGKLVEWDPIIINQNGGVPFVPFPLQNVVIGVGAALLALAAALGLRGLLDGKRRPRR